jgi:hypothetical protein
MELDTGAPPPATAQTPIVVEGERASGPPEVPLTFPRAIARLDTIPVVDRRGGGALGGRDGDRYGPLWDGDALGRRGRGGPWERGQCGSAARWLHPSRTSASENGPHATGPRGRPDKGT